ncbi:MAG: hypothetical protein HZA15_10655 [Nitrospirae bacterium]|nr:hypothetical protein [Nitrospirota bacterium]
MHIPLLARLFLMLLTMLIPAAAVAGVNTLDELEKVYGDKACMTCHEKVHGEWQKSLHSKSVVHVLGGLRNFITFGLTRDWKKPVDKANLMRCMHCHAPLLEHASESLMADIGALIVAAFDGKEGAKKELSRLNVNCIVCHNTAAIVETNLRGQPKPGVYYGPTGKTTPAHGTEKSAAITTSAFCSRCHWLYTPPDGDTLYCNTLYGSYQDAYRSSGGAATCQDCHMKSKGRGHTFPGAYEPEMVREGISMDLHATGAILQPGKGIKTAVIIVGLMNNAGHRIPDG